MARRSRFALEELEVDKVYREQQQAEAGDEFDELYTNIRQEKEVKREQSEADDNSASDTSEPLSEGEGTDDVNVENSDGEPDADIATESFLSEHKLAIEAYIAQEDIFTKDNLLTAGQVVGGAAVDSLVWLKNIGFQYGPVLLKHVYKGVLFALNKTLRGIVKGTVAIAKYVDKRMNSYTAIKEKINKAREAINLIEKDGSEEAVYFHDPVIIQQLVISNHTDVKKNVEVALKYFKDFNGSFETKVNNHLTGIARLIDNVIKTNGSYSGQYSPSVFIPSNFKKGVVQGYKPEHEEIDSYVYENALPGDICVIGFFPKPDLTDRDAISSALTESKLFLGVNVNSVSAEKSVPFKSKAELLQLLDVLESVCNAALASEKTLMEVSSRRNGLKSYLTRYGRFLFNLKEKMSIYDSMADIISLELQYLDKTYISGSLQLHDYLTRVLNASLAYVRENIKTLS